MSRTYRLMIYFAHSTMVMYSKSIISQKDMSPEKLYEQNENAMKRVFDEGVSIMNYELSHEQMMRACYCYLSAKYNPQSIYGTEVYVPKESKN